MIGPRLTLAAFDHCPNRHGRLVVSACNHVNLFATGILMFGKWIQRIAAQIQVGIWESSVGTSPVAKGDLLPLPFEAPGDHWLTSQDRRCSELGGEGVN